jgi:hypothetical protein
MMAGIPPEEHAPAQPGIQQGTGQASASATASTSDAEGGDHV